MGFLHRYTQRRPRFLADESICPENRALFTQFLDFEEYKLKRTNGLAALDEGCGQTLYGYIIRLTNVNRWFGNKPWVNLTKEDIKRVYDALEDGTIRSQHGTPMAHRTDYYNKVMRGKPFRLAGKDALAREVIQFVIPQQCPVRYVTEEVFRTLVCVVANPRHLALLWLAWDLGENVSALCKLTRSDFTLQTNRVTGEREYVVRLASERLKRSRTARSELTLYPETVRLLDIVLRGVGPKDLVFVFGYASAKKFLNRAVRLTGAVTQPDEQLVRWKDLRSGMACHLLRNGWTRDEVDARLGHTPNSKALGAYINFTALDRNAPKMRMRGASTAFPRLDVGTAESYSIAPMNSASKMPSSAHHEALAESVKQIEELRARINQIARSVALAGIDDLRAENYPVPRGRIEKNGSRS